MVTQDELNDHLKAFDLMFVSWDLVELIIKGYDTITKIFEYLEQTQLKFIEIGDIMERFEYLIDNEFIYLDYNQNINKVNKLYQNYCVCDNIKDRISKIREFVTKYPILEKSVLEYIQKTGFLITKIGNDTILHSLPGEKKRKN